METILQNASHQIFLIYTVGIPGLGKSSLVNKLRDFCLACPQTSIEVCVSDEVRSKVLANEYAARSLDVNTVSQDEVFRVELESGPTIKEEFNRLIAAKLNMLRLQTNTKLKLLVIDKNYCSKELVNYVSNQAKTIFPDASVGSALLLPQALENEEESNLGPLKFSTMIIGLVRSLNRSEHPTMKYGPVHSMLSFVTCLKNHCADLLEEKFPVKSVKRIHVRYFKLEKASEFLQNPVNAEQFKRLKEILTDIVENKAQIAAKIECVLNGVHFCKSMSEFIDYGEEEMLQVMKNIIQ